MNLLDSMIEKFEKRQIELNALVKREKRVALAFGLTIGLGFVLCATGVGVFIYENNKVSNLLETASEDPAFIEYRDQDLKNHYIQYEQDGDIDAYNAFAETVTSKNYILDYLAKQPDSTVYSDIESAKTKQLASDIVGIVGGATSLGAIGTYIIGFDKTIPAREVSKINQKILKKLQHWARQNRYYEHLPRLPKANNDGKEDENE